MYLQQPIVIASNNQAKTNELIMCFNYCGFTAIAYTELIERLSFPAEGCQSYVENASAKAHFLAEKLPGKLIVADDSGMELAARPGELGITTARELSDYKTAKELNEYLIRITRNQAKSVTMVSHLVLTGLDHDYIGVGKFEGKIADEERGSNGSGFDLILEDVATKQTLAQMDNQHKIPLLHRTKAIQDLLRQIGVN